MKTLNVLKYIGFGILGVGAIFLFVYVTMALWNWLVPALFNGPVLSFWQAAGLMILSKILFAGFSPGCRSSHSEQRKDYWRKKYRAKYCGDEGEKGEVQV
jgi:hypothetical protein